MLIAASGGSSRAGLPSKILVNNNNYLNIFNSFFPNYFMKKSKESKSDGILSGMYENVVGLIFAAAILGLSAGIVLKTCNTLEQKAEQYYYRELEQQQSYNLQDYSK